MTHAVQNLSNWMHMTFMNVLLHCISKSQKCPALVRGIHIGHVMFRYLRRVVLCDNFCAWLVNMNELELLGVRRMGIRLPPENEMKMFAMMTLKASEILSRSPHPLITLTATVSRLRINVS